MSSQRFDKTKKPMPCVVHNNNLKIFSKVVRLNEATHKESLENRAERKRSDGNNEHFIQCQTVPYQRCFN